MIHPLCYSEWWLTLMRIGWYSIDLIFDLQSYNCISLCWTLNCSSERWPNIKNEKWWHRSMISVSASRSVIVGATMRTDRSCEYLYAQTLWKIVCERLKCQFTTNIPHHSINRSEQMPIGWCNDWMYKLELMPIGWRKDLIGAKADV